MEWLLVALVCPISMGLMMLFMARSMRGGQGRETPPPAAGGPEPVVEQDITEVAPRA